MKHLSHKDAVQGNAAAGVIRVCMGGTTVKEFPIQPLATHETLRNIYCGHIQLPQSDLDAYNRMTGEINRATYHTDREFLLNQRHRLFVDAMFAQRDSIAKAARIAD